LISNIYVSVGIGIELLKWLAPIWPLTTEGGKKRKEIEKENARKDRKKKTAPLLQIYVSDVKFWSRRGIVYWLSTFRSALCPREHHTLVTSTCSSKLITPDFFPFFSLLLFIFIACRKEKLLQTNERYY
jgi:hypothetical protein